MKRGNPTNAEREWMQDIQRIGCCVCYALGYPETPGEVHHLLDESHRRIGHLATICLCSPGHHRNGNDKKVSRHPSKTDFEEAYGKEEFLLTWTRHKVAELRANLVK